MLQPPGLRASRIAGRSPTTGSSSMADLCRKRCSSSGTPRRARWRLCGTPQRGLWWRATRSETRLPGLGNGPWKSSAASLMAPTTRSGSNLQAGSWRPRLKHAYCLHRAGHAAWSDAARYSPQYHGFTAGREGLLPPGCLLEPCLLCFMGLCLSRVQLFHVSVLKHVHDLLLKCLV